MGGTNYLIPAKMQEQMGWTSFIDELNQLFIEVLT